MPSNSFRVEAQVDGPGAYWTKILVTGDRDYATATYEQFREADVPVRLIEPEKGKRRADRDR